MQVFQGGRKLERIIKILKMFLNFFILFLQFDPSSQMEQEVANWV